MLEALFLGLLQGLTEFLPISSSAHLRIAGEFFGTPSDPGATFTAITQIGTELAVLLYFRRDIIRILSATVKALARRNFQSPDARLGIFIALGSLPIIALGYLGQETIRTTFRSLWLIAIVLVLFGILLGIADRYGRRELNLDHLTPKHALFYGIAQSLALIPGVSRSGATIAMGRILGYDRVSALRYSFLLALPAVFGSGLYELRTALISPEANPLYTMTETCMATAVAFVVGYVVIRWLLRFVSTKSFMPFVLYRVALGSVLLILISVGAIQS